MKKAFISLFFIFFTAFSPSNLVFAQLSENCTASFTGDKWMVLNCSQGFASVHDRIRIYAPSGFDTSQPWQTNLNYAESVWIFEVGSEERANLIIHFHQEPDGLMADLYDDGDGDNRVSFIQNNDGLLVTENNGNWSLRVISRAGWWTKGGKVNYNLDLLVDGKMQAAFVEDVRQNLVKEGKLNTDGTVDFKIHVRDLDGDGRPDHEWRQKLYPLPEDPQLSGQIRTEIIVNTEDDELSPVEGVFWPYLSQRTGDYNKGRLGLPPIQVDWERAQIARVSEFIRARSEPGSYSIYSIERMKEGETTTVDFENPFAFYDLANARDGYPDLNIRFGLVMPYSPLTDYQNTTPLNDIQYVWDQYHIQHWDYQVGLSGRHTIDEVIQFPEFAIRTVPYEKLPEWVTTQVWDVATFVQVEKTPFYNSEIVWEWNTTLGTDAVRREYLPGISDAPPVDDFASIAIGMRGEYALDYGSAPVLYFSPVDRKLHLVKADKGIFNLDDQRIIEYENLGGSYINQWTLLENENLVKSLVFDSGYLIYADLTSVQLTRSETPPALFTTLPPHDHEEWVKLGTDLEQNRPNFSPDDFKAMLDQFGEANVSIAGASLRDFRLIEGGFRLVLNLQKGFLLNGEDRLGLVDQAPGEYVLSYDGNFSLDPLTPPAIQLSFAPPDAADHLLAEHTNINFLLSLHNEGLEDAQQVRVDFGSALPGQEITWSDPQVVSVLGGETAQVRFLWAPDSPGEWKLLARARLLDHQAGILNEVISEQVLHIQPAQQPGFRQGLSAFGVAATGQVGLLAVFLLVMAGLVGGAFSMAVRLNGDHSTPDREQGGQAQTDPGTAAFHASSDIESS